MEKIFTVSEYIKVVNIALERFWVRVAGEVTQAEVCSKGHIYFSIKDKKNGSVLNCLIWKSIYQMCGVKLEEGLEVILSGYSEIYPPTGKLSFKAKTIELKGEGALKKAYEELKKRLAQEGFFSEERKKPLPEFPQKIGVITSRQGAVLQDFLGNLGRFGFRVALIDSRVEGQEAVRDLVLSVQAFRKKEIDALLIMRGGGSLESLQAFNNETLVRAIIDFPAPVIAAIGHEKDVPLLALAADIACSTPTAAANLLNKSWEMAPIKINQCERFIFENFSQSIFQTNRAVWRLFSEVSSKLDIIFENFRKSERSLAIFFAQINQTIVKTKMRLRDYNVNLIKDFSIQFRGLMRRLFFFRRTIQAHSPERNLALGYCIAWKKGGIIKSVGSVRAGDDIDLRLRDGTINSQVIKVSQKYGRFKGKSAKSKKQPEKACSNSKVV